MLNQEYIRNNQDCTLHVEGNRVYNARGEKVRLAGVNTAAMEWLSECEYIHNNFCTAMDGWHANVIRLPLAQDRWFGFGDDQEGRDPAGYGYRDIIDGLVNEAAKRRKYIIIDLHRSNYGQWGVESGGGPMPDSNSVVFWKDVAFRYRNHPNVLFDLFNEPFFVSWQLWKDGGHVDVEHDLSGEMRRYTFDTPGMQKLLSTVRGTGAKNICVIGGLDWSFELDGLVNQVTLDDEGGNGLILDTHVYPWKPMDWDRYVTVAADRYPILVGECGHRGGHDISEFGEGPAKEPCEVWVPKLLNWIDQNEYHVTAWDFHHEAGPCLVKNITDFEPTEFWGAYFKEYLLRHNG